MAIIIVISACPATVSSYIKTGGNAFSNVSIQHENLKLLFLKKNNFEESGTVGKHVNSKPENL